MIRHILKLVWQRKRANTLLILEIAVSFVVLFGVTTLCLSNLRYFGEPLGFDPEPLYTITINGREIESRLFTEESGELTARLLKELEELPNVVETAAMDISPFELTYTSRNLEHLGRSVEGRYTAATDGGLETLGLKMVEGRWFEPADDALHWTPVVINRMMAEELFPDGEVIGKQVREEPEWRVVGVIDSFRLGGRLSALRPGMIERISLAAAGDDPPQRIVIRVAPGSGAEIEERALATLRAVAPDWTFQIEPTENVRRRNQKLAATPIIVALLMAASLMIMVALGMIGVFWQSVTRRIDEIGLRRAVGSPRGTLYWQLLGEILVVTLMGSLMAALLVVQLPLLGIFGNLKIGVVAAALGVTLVVLCCLSTVAGLYPAWLAARLEPALALRDD